MVANAGRLRNSLIAVFDCIYPMRLGRRSNSGVAFAASVGLNRAAPIGAAICALPRTP